jgi:type I restriction enzyme R subunit
MTTNTSESGLEALIEAALTGGSPTAAVAEDSPAYGLDGGAYLQGSAADYDRGFCLDRVQLVEFLRATQPRALEGMEKADGPGWQQKFFKRLFDQIQKKGVVEVLRSPVKHGEFTAHLYYKKPSGTDNPETVRLWQANRFSVVRQLRYSESEPNRSLDLALFINGLPVATFELKNQLTKQNVKDAIRQYQTDRSSKEPLFAFGRCMVHFAVDDALVYMTTHLRNGDTTFLPFNKGHDNGAGNPPNPDGLKTAYLWEQVLTRDSLANIIENFARIVEEEDDQGRKKQKMVFPRYHQLDVVRKLVAHAREYGAGQRYLIQHSAGSGKSNSITWLAHQLVETRRGGKPVFDSVIVVTDRRVLDRQIRDNIRRFAHVKGVVEAITEGSRQLREALEDGKKIIITTVQKFPFVVKEIQSLKQTSFAIIIDEAHSSQGGRAAGALNASLSKGDDPEEEETTEDKINRLIEEQKMLPNASYFAFTATPKSKTLEIFGTKDSATGKFHPFHVYSMKQAIEEEFILDVLKAYTTYSTYVRLLKTIEDDPEFETSRAQKKLKKYVEGHPEAIRQKAEIMIDHFLTEVVKKRKIKGQAKAMVVTSSIVAAIRYRQAFDAYLREKKSPYRALVAFSGSKEVDGISHTEEEMNALLPTKYNPSADTAVEFKMNNAYRFLIVAEKYQTGFDEPLLHTMYVDKPLSDIKAVQTLSRLNRAYKPYKTDTFVLDFVNKVETIREAFERYYRPTILSEETDINRLNDLQESLDASQVYSREQVEALMAHFINGDPRDKLDPILDVCVEEFKELSEDQQADFKAKAKGFVRAYRFIAQVATFSNTYWESLATFLNLLVPKLPNLNEGDLAQGILDAIDMSRYGIEQQQTIDIRLGEAKELEPTPTEVGGGKKEPEFSALSEIVKIFNDRFQTDWENRERMIKVLFKDIPADIAQDEEYLNTKKNSDRQNAEITYRKKLEEKMQEIIFDHTELYRRYSEDPLFRKWLESSLFQMDYDGGKGRTHDQNA